MKIVYKKSSAQANTQYEELDEETLRIIKSREKNAKFISSEEFWDQMSKELGMNLRCSLI